MGTRKLVTALSGLALAGLLAACGSRVPEAFRDSEEAWRAGCRSGLRAADYRGHGGGLLRDEAAYRAEPRYRAAWDDGYGRCARAPWIAMPGEPDGEARDPGLGGGAAGAGPR